MALRSIVELASEIISKYPLCSYCLGRLFARNAKGLRNKSRGDSLKAVLNMELDRLSGAGVKDVESIIRGLASSGWEGAQALADKLSISYNVRRCPLCLNNLSEDKMESIVLGIAEELKDYEFDSFVVGSIVPRVIKSLEEQIFAEFSLTDSEDLKKEISREIGRRLEKVIGKRVNFANPDVTILVDLFRGVFEIRPAHLFIYGRYVKHVGGLPQTPWLCRNCWGAGCTKCGNKGKEYETSLAEIIGSPAMKLAMAIGYKFHAAGREDIDAKVEGSGRPFIVELISPRRRNINLDEYRELVNQNSKGIVEIFELEFSSRAKLRLLKSGSEKSQKRYLAVVKFEDPISEELLREVEGAFTNRVIDQWTPRRVLKRRVDKLRRRRVYEIRAKKLDESTIELELLVDGGLYVKELIHGDEGRTRPAIIDIIHSRPLSIELTVLAVVDKH